MRVTQRSRRWLVPVAAVGMIAGGAALGPSVADASPDLPDITAQQLLANVQTAKVDGLSGTVRINADLGLPALPGIGGGPHAAELTDLLAGKHTIRVAYAAPDKARVSVLDDMSERVFVTDGTTGWQYDSSQREASKFAVPKHTGRAERPASPDPQTVAKLFLDAIDPTTKVTVTGTKSVAGRDAYLLTLTPRTDRTTVGSVTLAVDAKRWVPLRATVMPRTGGDPAFEVGFADVSFATPTASTFSFTPPKGTKITEGKAAEGRRDRGRPGEVLPSEPDTSKPLPVRPPADKNKDSNAPTVIGKGWDAVVMARTGAPDQMVRQLLSKAPTVSGSWGSGKVLTSRMVSVLFTDDGRVFAGLVTPSVLQEAAAKAPR